MDSVSQFVLGAGVGEAILGRKLGNRAILWGAAFGTLPDLDFLITPFVDTIGVISYHRSLSHSLFGVAITSPAFAWLFHRWYRDNEEPITYHRWLQFFIWVFLTHILLDCCTTYGTQFFYPFFDTRVALKSISIVDPLYTVPFLVCVLTCLFLSRDTKKRSIVNWAGLIISTAYLAFTIGNKLYVDHVFAKSLSKQGITATRFMTTPTLLNNVLWCGIAEVDDGYHVGFYSLFDESDDLTFEYVPHQHSLLGDFAGTHAVDRLIWFADGYYVVRPHPDGVLLHVMKFGKINIEGEAERYAFSYVIRNPTNPTVEFHSYGPSSDNNRRARFKRLWTRMMGQKERAAD